MERPISSGALARVQAAVFNGEKITAIKIYREDTGASLKEAKEAVEKLESEWRGASPERFAAPARKKMGCGICLVILLVGLAVLVLMSIGVLRN